MPDPNTFEARLDAALGRYADQISTDVDAVAFVRATRALPARTGLTWRPAPGLRTALLLGLLVALAVAVAALVGGQPSPEPPAVTNGLIAYATSPGLSGRELGRTSEIYLVREGVEPRLIAGAGDGSVRNVCPGFSPDGTMLAYGERHLPPQGDGSQAIVVLTFDDGGSIIEPVLRLPVADAGAAPCPAWSPDGLRLAFPVAAGFVVMRLDGTSTLIEVQSPGDISPAGGGFDWSPDGTMIASVRPSGTWLIPVDGGPPRLFATQAASTVSWSPDGAWLAMGDWDGEDSHARLLPVAGVGEEVDLGAGTSRPLWSPSGDRIAYLGRRGIRVADADGSDEKVVTDRGWGPMAWSPDGRQLLHVEDGSGCCGFNLLATSTTTPGLPADATEVVVLNLQAYDAPIGPGRGDMSWQPVVR